MESAQMLTEEFRTLWLKHKLPSRLLVDVRDRTALTKALKDLAEKKLVRKIIDDETEIVYVIVREDVDVQKRDVDFTKENHIIYDKITHTVDFKEVSGTFPEEVRQAFARYSGRYTSREIRKITTNTIKRYGGITVRTSGGMYFVPSTPKTDKAMEALSALFKEIPGANEFTPMGIVDRARYRESLLVSVRRELTGDFRREEAQSIKLLRL